MASNFQTRFLPIHSSASQSIYETIRQYDDEYEGLDIEDRAAIGADEENLAARFEDYELEDALARADIQSTRSSNLGSSETGEARLDHRQQWRQAAVGDAEDDDGPPASLLVEGNGDEEPLPPPPNPHSNHVQRVDDGGVPDFSSPQLQSQWQATREHQPIHPGPQSPNPINISSNRRSGLVFADPKEKAMWRWANVENLDNFFRDVYVYFIGNGIWCIVLSRALNIL